MSIALPETPVRREFPDGEVYEATLLHALGHRNPVISGDELLDRMDAMWEESKKHDRLFSDFTRGDPKAFFNLFRSPRSVWYEVRESGEVVGAMYATEILPNLDADAHFTFWDGSLGWNRAMFTHDVMKAVMRWASLERLTAEIPEDEFVLRKFYERKVGLTPEGKRRHAFLFDDQWRDTVRFGILKDELDEAMREDMERIERFSLEKEGAENGRRNEVRHAG